MANEITKVCRAVQLPATQKAVLMCLADFAHDDGRDWHSITGIMEWTCLGKTAVIEAMKSLEALGLIRRVHRGNGLNSMTLVQVDTISARPEVLAAKAKAEANRSASRTGPPAEPVREANPTSPPDGPDQSATRTSPVRQADTKHQEASDKHQEALTKTRKRAQSQSFKLPEFVPADAWDDFEAMRKTMRKPMTAKARALMVLKLIKLRDAGQDARAVLEQSVARSWTDLYAVKGQQQPHHFNAQQYTEVLPP